MLRASKGFGLSAESLARFLTHAVVNISTKGPHLRKTQIINQKVCRALAVARMASKSTPVRVASRRSTRRRGTRASALHRLGIKVFCFWFWVVVKVRVPLLFAPTTVPWVFTCGAVVGANRRGP